MNDIILELLFSRSSRWCASHCCRILFEMSLPAFSVWRRGAHGFCSRSCMECILVTSGNYVSGITSTLCLPIGSVRSQTTSPAAK